MRSAQKQQILSESSLIHQRFKMIRNLKTAWPLMVALLSFAALALVLSRTPAPRVGDGSEYYALFFAWRDTFRPFMTSISWESYQSFCGTDEIAYLVRSNALKSAFPALISGNTADFNHFWFYSLFPAVVGRILRPFGTIQPQFLFLGFHWLLAALPMSLSWKYFKWPGLVAVVTLLLLSPILWYYDKVHTEFFTVSLVLTSVIFFRANRLIPSALFLALASTQNVSFLAVAITVALLDCVQRRGREAYSLPDTIGLIATAFVITLHPLYYFFRLGALDPQFVAGGAAVGANLKSFYLWFIDPDLGLLPNWPLGLVTLLVGSAITLIDRRKFDELPRVNGGAHSSLPWVIYVVAYLVINLTAQSSTQNLNSGATPGLARYGVWYIPLFFPLFAMLASAGLRPFHPHGLRGDTTRSTTGSLGAKRWLPAISMSAIVAMGAWYSMAFFRPALTEIGAYQASWSSAFVQRRLPAFYNPPAEVFMERYGGVMEDPALNDARAIVGPDCRKLLIQSTEKQRVFGGGSCAFSARKLVNLLNADAGAVRGHFPRYMRLTAAQAEQARYSPVWNGWLDLGAAGEQRGPLVQGWGSSEAWGVWSSGSELALNFPCEGAPAGTSAMRIDLALRPFLAEGHKRIDTEFLVNGQLMQRAAFEMPEVGERVVSLTTSMSNCKNGLLRLDIRVIEPASPASLKLSDDPRLLGIGLSRFRQSGV